MRAERYDAVIVGAGFAGLSAGNVAAAQGLKVAVLEAQRRPWLNNSRIATGVLHFAFAHPKSDAAALAERLTAVTEGAARPDLVDHASRTAAATVDWLAMQGAELRDIDYGKGPLPVLQPQRRFQQGLDWQSRGCARLLDRLTERFTASGGVIVDGAEARDLVRKGDGVGGVIARRGAEEIRFEAESVVIADGGFQANRRLVQRFIAPAVDKIKLRATPSGHGRGIELAEAAGAKLVLTDCFYGHLQSPQAFTNDDLWPYPNLDSSGDVGNRRRPVRTADRRRGLGRDLAVERDCAPRQSARLLRGVRHRRLGGRGDARFRSAQSAAAGLRRRDPLGAGRAGAGARVRYRRWAGADRGRLQCGRPAGALGRTRRAARRQAISARRPSSARRSMPSPFAPASPRPWVASWSTRRATHCDMTGLELRGSMSQVRAPADTRADRTPVISVVS